MSIFEPARSPWTGRMLSVLRIVAGLVFLTTGTMKVFGYPASPQAMPPFDPLTQLGIAGLLEVIGGLLLIIGLFVRPVSFVLAGEMAVAYFQAHFPQSFFPTVNNGIPAILYCFIFLYFVFAGGGSWSLDAVLARSRARGRPATASG